MTEPLDDSAVHSADHLPMALAAANLGTWDFDLASAAVYCSPRCKKILGIPPQGTVTPEGLLESIHRADFPRLQRAYATATAPDATGDISTDFRLHGVQDGRERWVRLRGRTHFDKGQPVRIVGTAEDVTALKCVELERSRDSLFNQALTRNVGDGLYAIDRAGHVTFLNAAAEKLLGWSESDLLGRDIHETIHFQHPDLTPFPRDACPLMAVLESGTTVRSRDDTFTRKDGTILPVAYSSSPMTDGGEIVGAVVAFRDVSERKAAERDQDALLTGERAARGRAEHALKERDTALNATIHNLRTPLNGILGWAQLLLEQTPAPGEMRDGLLAIVRGVNAQNDILTRLASAAPGAVPARLHDPTTLPNIAGLRVLVVDDDNDARRLVKRLLEGVDALVLTAANADEALHLVEQIRPDILVSDISMPGVDGYTLLKQIRALGKDRGGEVPAIAVTAFARTEDRTLALLAGYRVHIPKPLDASELITTIASLAGRL